MRISGKSATSGSPSVGGTKVVSGVSATPVTPAVGAIGDALDVSGAAQFLAVAQAQLASIPEVRTDKVEALRAKLESDSYHPDSEAVADGIVREYTPPEREP